MQNSKYSISRSLGFFSLGLVVIVLLGLNGCENPGSVGTQLSGPGADVVVDTVTFSGIDTTQSNGVASGRTYFSAGQFDDPIFGTMNAIGMLQPKLPLYRDSVDQNGKMMMRLYLKKNEVYGDTAASQRFDIYEIGEYWDPRNRLVKDDIEVNTSQSAGAFTVDGQDSLDVKLFSTWYNKYFDYSQSPAANADSLYQHELPGLAIVPSNNGKVMPFIVDSTDFYIVNPDSDSVSVGVSKLAYSLDRTNESYPAGSLPLYSTFESLLNFSLDSLNTDVDPSTISRAELILYQNDSAMTQSLQSSPSSVQRPPEKNIKLYLTDPGNAPQNIPSVSLIGQGAYNAKDGGYHINITSALQQVLLNKIPEGYKFLVTFDNNGVITPSLIYTGGDQVPDNKKPKIVITHLKNTNK